ncbi:hypothetical protein AB0E19_35585, partial [Streptomyces sp. NPDC047974]
LAQLGDTEWRDVDAVLRYAVRRGASKIVLHGWGTGATMALRAAAESGVRDRIAGLVLDSPVLDWEATVRNLAAARGVPGPLVPLAVRAALGRTGPHPDHSADLRIPVLLAHGPDDTISPWERSVELAARRPDLVTLLTVRQAPHTAMWNADPLRYEEALRRYLTPLM